MAPPNRPNSRPEFNKKASDEPRVNNEITSAQIRLIDADGNMLGVVAAKEGVRQAEAAGLDLVEISPNAEPPVCKIMDYGKFKYEAQKKAHEARKKQKVISIKEIKVRPTTDKHDLEIKLKQLNRFLDEGDKVKVSMRFKGREIAHNELGYKVMESIKAQLTENAKIETDPRMEGRQMFMMIAPK